jgi:Peptidase M76 family
VGLNQLSEWLLKVVLRQRSGELTLGKNAMGGPPPPQCHVLLQALLAHAQRDEKSRVGILLRSLGATWQPTDYGATIILLDAAVNAGSAAGNTAENNSNNSNNTGTSSSYIPLICRPCSWTGQESKVRAFVTDPPSMVFCTGRCESDLETILVHELTHLFDLRRLHLNLRHSCHDLAYSEIRAAKFAECYRMDTTNDDDDHDFAVAKCIRRHALVATATALQQREPKERHAVRSCIEDVYQSAMSDNRPFE